MESSIKEFIRLQNREVIDEVRSDKLKRLEDMLHKKDEELKSKKEFADKIKTGVILLSVSSLIAYVAWTTKVFIGKA